MLCKPPLDHNKSMVDQNLEQPPHDMHDDNPLLGWVTMVAPTSKTAVPPGTCFSDPPIPWNVSKLPGGVHESAKMAPPLHSVIKKILEIQKVQNEDIDNFLKSNKSWTRYDSAFKLLWGICAARKMTLENMTLQQMAGNILFLNKYSPSKARNAYSALLFLPGWDQLRFSPLLSNFKRGWQSTQAKYSTFWDAQDVLKKLAENP